MTPSTKRRNLLLALALATATPATQACTKAELAKAADPAAAAAACAAAAAEDAAMSATADSAMAVDAPTDAADERPIIERTLILAPEQAGDFTLIAAQDYPGQPEAGVGLRYRHADFPEVIIDLYVYPFGRGERDQLMPVVMDAIKGELREVEAAGDYADLEFGDVEEFDLQRVDVDGSLLAQRPAASADAATDPDIGRRLPIRLVRQGDPAQSLAFLFYRHMYLHKGRISTTMDVSSDNFERLANRAMADIVPRVIVRNTGGCAEHSISLGLGDLDGSRGDNTAVLATRIAEASARVVAEGCGEPMDESVPDGYRVLDLDVSGIWAPPTPRAPGKKF